MLKLMFVTPSFLRAYEENNRSLSRTLPLLPVCLMAGGCGSWQVQLGGSCRVGGYRRQVWRGCERVGPTEEAGGARGTGRAGAAAE